MIGTIAKILAYVLGQALHIALQADAIKRSRNNATASYGTFLRLNGVRLAWRAFLCTMIFIFLWSHPTALVELFKYIGWNIPDKISWLLSLPMTIPTAGAFGLVVDALLSFIPGLKNLIPKLDEPTTL